VGRSDTPKTGAICSEGLCRPHDSVREAARLARERIKALTGDDPKWSKHDPRR